MNKELLCTWLGLPKAGWPPDAWALLGVARDENDLATIEERVHDRMKKLRCYQLSHPEEATEGMNRLAEAFITLTDICTKSKPPAAQPVVPSPTNGAPSKDETSVLDNTKLDWRDQPPPVRQEAASTPELLAEEEAVSEPVLVSRPFVAPSKPQARGIDTPYLRELAEESDEATRNIGTLDALILRVESTRRLLHAWERVGKHLKATSKKVHPKDTEQFAKRLQAITDVMSAYPGFVAQPGKPGYRVMVLAQFKMPLANVRAMPAEQRDDLLLDWQTAYQVLLLHRKYLHRRFKSMRHRTTVGLILVAVRSLLNDYPWLTLAGLLVVLLLIAATVLAIYAR